MIRLIAYFALLLLLISSAVFSQGEKITLDYSNGPFEVVLVDGVYLIYVDGPARFSTETGFIFCDSATWKKGEWVRLNGNVLIDDADYKLAADSIYYDIIAETVLARGQHVEIWLYEDSVYATGSYAFFDKKGDFFNMINRPTLITNYPDTANMVEVVSNELEYDKINERAEAMGNVTITSNDLNASAGCAQLDIKTNSLDLFEKPLVKRNNSDLRGAMISIYFDQKVLTQIDVLDSASATFMEPVNDDSLEFDRSDLRGRRIILDFDHGALSHVLCYGQSYSWFYPSRQGALEEHENAVSGDTIRFNVFNNRLETVVVIGGAVGTYIKRELDPSDTSIVKTADTVDYDSYYIEYNLKDSMITLLQSANVNSGTVSLSAHKVLFDTNSRLIEAFSASAGTAESGPGAVDLFSTKFQPNDIPVMLRDNDEDILGDYLIYSIDTKKGRIVKSKTDFETGYYYGEKLYREQEKIFYIDDGRYTTCNAGEPHFHFHSSNMKLIEGDKLIARPVVFYIERIPIFALPFYIFPLKHGRHSGILPFTFGKFERGERYVRNVGYYWAASEYYDWQASFDYHEESQNITFNSKVNYSVRYKLNGYLSGSYLRDTNYDLFTASESKRNRWVFDAVYNHNVSPSFTVRANGRFVSDKTYFTDFSSNQDDRLDKLIKSQASFSKRFGRSTSLSGNFSHIVNLDEESRIDNIPSMSLSLPTIFPFGNGKKDETGKLKQSWYNSISFRYSPSLTNFSSRVTLDTSIINGLDTTIVSYRSRREYARISHNPGINLPTIRLGYLANIIPRIGYSETWFKIYETDQSLAAGIDAGETYRTYSYNVGVTANTKLYGAIYPNVMGLIGLRHVFSPSITYSSRPDIDRHPAVRKYAGGGAGSKKSSILSVAISNTLQAKVRDGDAEKAVEIITTNSGFSYNYENKTRPYSDLRTSFRSGALGRISLSGSMTHSFYKPDTDELDFLSPNLLDFEIQGGLRLTGSRFIFDDVEPASFKGADSAGQLRTVGPRPGSRKGRKGWSFSANYRYRESRRGGSITKLSSVSINLSFNLTPSTSIRYSQYYDIENQLTVYNSVNIKKIIHCWTGSLYWVPVGSNRGFGFKIFVTAIPEIKLDNKHDSFVSSIRR